MKKRPANLKEYAFTDLTDEDIQELEIIFKYWYRGNCDEERLATGLYLNDPVDFRALRATHYDGQALGRVYCWEEDGRKLAYLLAFDTLDFKGKGQYYLRLVKDFIRDDRSFLSNIIYLAPVSFVYHLGVSPSAGKGHAGINLLNCFMDECRRRKVRLVVAAIDSGQHGILRILQRERLNLIFLNHQFSEKNPEEIRFRVAELLDQKTFLERINDNDLEGTYDFVIPMQLNIATESINRMLRETGVEAKILWTSFFHNVRELSNLNGMNQFYQGFYQPVLDGAKSDQPEARKEQIDTLREISKYLKLKHENKYENHPLVASLIPSLEKKGFEFFFINDFPEDHDFSHFTTPKVFDIRDEEAVNDWLNSRELLAEEQMLDSEEKMDWFKDLARVVRTEHKKHQAEREYAKRTWEKWKARLNLSTRENKQLLRFQRETRDNEGQMPEEYKAMVKEINTRRLRTPQERQLWKDWFALHRQLYQSDLRLEPTQVKKKTWWCHAVIPVSFSQGINGVMLTFTCRTKPRKGNDKHKLVASLADIIANTLSRNMLNIVNKLYLNNFDTALSRFQTAALSARNLSHNVGSHVYSFLSQPSELQEIIWRGHQDHMPADFSDYKGISDLAKFFTFTKVRMSLLADMATNEPVASTAEWLKGSLLYEFNEQHLLKQYIKGNSNRQVNLRYFNSVMNEQGEGDDKDILVQVPNGVLGRSAFLMILVNYLRNSIKYSPYTSGNDVEMNIVVSQAENSQRLLKIVLHDEIGLPLSEVEKEVNKINSNYIFREGLHNDRFQLVQEGLGFAEMVAAARYLRKRPFGNAWRQTTDNDYPYLMALAVPAEEPDKAYLGICFYLKKPRPLLVIDYAKLWENRQEKIDELSSKGIKLRFAQQLLSWREESFSHEIAINLTSEDLDLPARVKAFTPRIVSVKKSKRLRNLLKEGNLDKLMKRVWKIWMRTYRQQTARVGIGSKTVCWISNNDPNASLPKVSSGDLLYDDHACWEIALRPNQSRPELGFYEFFQSHSPTGLVVDFLREEKNAWIRKRLNYLLEEAARTRIVIIDERIQQVLGRHEFGRGLFPGSLNPFNYLAGMGILVPDARIQGLPNFSDPADFYSQRPLLESYLMDLVDLKAVDFIVIHIGLIETTLRTSNPREIENWLYTHLPPDSGVEYVMISGRGKPLAIPARFRYLPYNSISRSVLDNLPSKFQICQSLFSARTRT